MSGNVKRKKKKEPFWAKMLLAVLSIISVTLSIVLKLINRQETLKVLKDDETLHLVSAKKTTTPDVQ